MNRQKGGLGQGKVPPPSPIAKADGRNGDTRKSNQSKIFQIQQLVQVEWLALPPSNYGLGCRLLGFDLENFEYPNLVGLCRGISR